MIHIFERTGLVTVFKHNIGISTCRVYSSTYFIMNFDSESSEVLTAVSLNIVVFWDVTPCRLVHDH